MTKRYFTNIYKKFDTSVKVYIFSTIYFLKSFFNIYIDFAHRETGMLINLYYIFLWNRRGDMVSIFEFKNQLVTTIFYAILYLFFSKFLQVRNFFQIFKFIRPNESFEGFNVIFSVTLSHFKLLVDEMKKELK